MTETTDKLMKMMEEMNQEDLDKALKAIMKRLLTDD